MKILKKMDEGMEKFWSAGGRVVEYILEAVVIKIPLVDLIMSVSVDILEDDEGWKKIPKQTRQRFYKGALCDLIKLFFFTKRPRIQIE